MRVWDEYHKGSSPPRPVCPWILCPLPLCVPDLTMARIKLVEGRIYRYYVESYRDGGRVRVLEFLGTFVTGKAPRKLRRASRARARWRPW